MVSNSPSLVGIVASVLLVACAQLWGATARAKMSPLEELSSFDIADPELKEVLEQSTEGYQDAISRFYGSGHIASVVRQGAGKALPVEDVTMSVGDSWVVSATEMSLSAPSSMEATVKSMDLRFPNLALSLELGDVTVEGAFLAQAPGQEPLKGKFTAELSGLTAGGRIGLRVSGDSLMPSMLDLDYNAADVSIKATTDTGVETTFDSEEIGAGVLRRLMERLSTPLNQHLTPIMAEAILEDSVEERLAGDEDTVELAKEHMDRASKLAVDVLSHLLRETTRADPGLALHELKLETDGGWVQVDRAVLQGAVMDVQGRAMIALVDGKVEVSGKIRLVPEKLEAVYSSSHVGAKMGRLVGNGGYSIFRVRVAVDANSAKPQLRVQRVALTQLRAPEITEATGPAALGPLVKAAVPALMETEGFVLKHRLEQGARL